jgi:anthranilate phosphoribosyltransferase
MVVHGADGMDEISFGGDTYVAELKDGRIGEYILNPAQFGFALHDVKSIQVLDSIQAGDMVKAVLAGEGGPARDIVLLNAGAAIYVSGLAHDMQQGMEQAQKILDNGAALAKLEQLAALSQQLAG